MADSLLLLTLLLAPVLLTLLAFRFSKLTGIINGVIFLLYAPFFWYLLEFESGGGSGFTWMFYLGIISLIHAVVLGIYLLVSFIQMRKQKGN
ncbi:MAG: hypothetical protein ACFB10_02770 [Salibacteraceae bacterium]